MFKEYREKWSSLTSPVKWAYGIGVFLVLYTLIGFFLIPFIGQKVLLAQLPKVLKRDVAIENVSFNPYTLNLEIEGFKVAKKKGDGNLVSFKKLGLNLDSFSIFRLALVITNVSFNELSVDVSVFKGGTSVSDLVPEAQEKSAGEEEDSGSLFPVVVDNFTMTNSTIKVFDQTKNKHHLISDININVPFTSTLDRNVKDFVQPSLSAVINGTPFEMKGKTLPFDSSLRTRFDFVIQKAELKDYRNYLPLPKEVQIANGTLSSTLSLVFDRGGQDAPKVHLAGDAEVDNFSLVHSDEGKLIAFKNFKIKFDDLRIMQKIAHINSVMIMNPYINMGLKKDGSLELLDYLLPQSKPAEKTVSPDFKSNSTVAVETDSNSTSNAISNATGPAENNATLPEETAQKRDEVKTSDESGDTPFLATVDSFDLIGGVVDLKDNAFGKGFEKKVGPINVSAQNITTAKGKYGRFSVDIGKKDGEYISTSGNLSLIPLDVNGSLAVSNMTVPEYHTYYEDFLPLDMTSGSLTVRSGFKFTPEAAGMNATTEISGLSVGLEKLKLEVPGKESPVVGIDSLGISNGTIDVLKKSVSVDSVNLDGGLIRIGRSRKGIDLVNLIDELQKSEKSSTGQAAAKPAADEVESEPWKVGVKKIGVAKTEFELIDTAASKKTVIDLENINVRADDFSLDGAKDMLLDISGQVNKRGSFAVNGHARMKPLSAGGTVSLKKIRLRDFNGYLPKKMQMNIARGHLDVAGQWDFKGGDKAAAGYKGKAQLKDLVIRDSSNNKAAFTLDELAVRDIDFKSEPLGSTVGLVDVVKPVVNVVREQDGTINFSRMITGKRAAPVNATAIEEQAEQINVVPVNDATVKAEIPVETNASVTNATAEGASEVSFMLEKVRLRDGSLVFNDLTVKPSFNMDISKMKADITKLGLPYGNRTGIVFNATVDDQSPLILTGELLPSGKNLKSGMKLNLSNLDMTQLSPYTLKYIAYPVSTGMLNANVDLALDGSEIAVGNLLDIFQFDVGDKVPNPDAANVPIGLGLALLKDSDGNIQLDIPVEGNLSDPQFRLGAVIGRAIVNLLIKAVTSPFALIGSLFGGGENMNVLAFDPGTDKLNESALKKIETIAKAMTERPGLNLEISGFSAAQQDRPALKELTFNRKIAMVKFLEIEGDEGAPKSVDDVKITQEEYPEYLEDVYKDEPFEKPTNIIGMVKTLPVPDMEKAVRDHIQITPSDLSRLARKRAEIVRDMLINEKGIKAERIFLKDSGQVKAQSAGPRVELGLK